MGFYPRLYESIKHLPGRTKEEIEKIHQKEKQQAKEEIERLRTKLRRIAGYNPGDDAIYGYGYSIGDDRSHLRHKIRNIQQQYFPEQIEKQEERNSKAWDKRVGERYKKEGETLKKLKTLTPRQKAINQIVDRQYWLRLFGNNGKNPWRKEIEDLKSEFNLKSTDIRRQKEYDPNYE